jgi:Protein of unknown function (DUF2865)
MTGSGGGRIDPRALLRSLKDGNSEGKVRAVSAAAASSLGRAGVIAVGAAVGLAAFGTLVVRANDDAGALAFIRSQTKPRAVVQSAPPQYAAPRLGSPVSYFAPRAFFQQVVPARQEARRSRPADRVQGQRVSPIVASYAPFAGFFPSMDSGERFSASRSPARVKTPSVARPAAVPNSSAGNGARGNRVTYCVRTCDGFFFPLSASSGSDRSDEAACNRLCPTAETKLYVGQVGSDIDEARSRQNGRRYAAMGNAFAYRTSFNNACSCNASGAGLTTEASVYRDQTLRVGDVVMTAKGMRVFAGGQFPYREANFTTIDRSGRFAGQSRETLRSMESASMPGRAAPASRDARRKTDELSDLRRAAQSIQPPSHIVRYVGPDRSAIAR